MVASEHGVDLRQRDVRLVDEGDEVFREIVDQAERALSGLTAVEIAAIVFDSGAVAEFFEHLDIVLDPLLDALGFEHLALALEVHHLLEEVVADLVDGGDGALFGGDEVVCRVDADFRNFLYHCSGAGVDHGDGIDLIAEKLDAYGVVGTAQKHVYGVAFCAERAAGELAFGAYVEGVHELIKKAGQRTLLPAPDGHSLLVEIVGIAYAVEAAYRTDYDHVAPAAQKRRSGGEAQLLDLIVDREVLLNIGVGSGEVGLRLVVVVV